MIALKDEMAKMGQVLSDNAVNMNDLSKAQKLLNQATHFTINGIKVMDNASLKRLHDQIDKAKQKMVDFADNAKQTMQDLQSELAGLQGNDDEVRRLKHAQKLADLETKIAQAKTQGNSEALAYYQKALELQQKINTEENRQASTKASQSATQANTKDITFGTHQNPSSELSAKDIGDMWEKHLDGIKQEAKREARAEFIQEMQDDIKRRAR